MRFKLVPILEKMKAIYQMPRTRERFDAYLFLLQGNNKDEMILPIAGYNPMGQENVLERLQELIDLEAELIVRNELENIGVVLEKYSGSDFEVVINLADNIGGSWSNFHTTDYSSKFDIAPLLNRNFCTPYFWTSEPFTKPAIAQRASEYVYRTIYWLENGKPSSLTDHVNQEIFVQSNLSNQPETAPNLNTDVANFFEENADSEEYNLIVNFFYGDEASRSLGFATYGMPENGGFDYVSYISNNN